MAEGGISPASCTVIYRLELGPNGVHARRERKPIHCWCVSPGGITCGRPGLQIPLAIVSRIAAVARVIQRLTAYCLNEGTVTDHYSIAIIGYGVQPGRSVHRNNQTGKMPRHGTVARVVITSEQIGH